MGIIVLLIIGYVIWKFISSGSSTLQTKEDKEFENMNLALKDDDNLGMF